MQKSTDKIQSNSLWGKKELTIHVKMLKSLVKFKLSSVSLSSPFYIKITTDLPQIYLYLCIKFEINPQSCCLSASCNKNRRKQFFCLAFNTEPKPQLSVHVKENPVLQGSVIIHKFLVLVLVLRLCYDFCLFLINK